MALTFEWNSRSGIEVYGFPQLNDCAYIAIVVVTPRAWDPLPFVLTAQNRVIEVGSISPDPNKKFTGVFVDKFPQL